MVHGTRTAAQVLATARRRVREHGYRIEKLPKRGKGSHTIWAVVDRDGTELGRIGLTGHPGTMTMTVTRSIEDALEPIFGRLDR